MQSALPSRVLLATAFSPRFLAGLAEAWRFAQRFDSSFSIVFAGERDLEKETILAQALDQLGIPSGTGMLWRPGDPVDAVVDAVREVRADLLIAGALIREREVSGRHFLGTVARGFLRRSPCSLLLVTAPRVQSRRYRRIAMITDFTEGARNALRAALALAERDEAESLHIITIQSSLALAREELEGLPTTTRSREQLLDDFAAIAAESPIDIELRVIDSATGVGVVEFLKTIRADLLVVPTAQNRGVTLLPPQMDWVSQIIPCDTWLAKKPAQKTPSLNETAT